MNPRPSLRAARLLPLAWCWMALVLLPLALPAQEISRQDRDRARTMLRQVRAQIERSYYDPAFAGVDLQARTAALDSLIQRSGSLAEAFAAVAQLTLELGDSHTFFVPPQRTVQVDYGWELMLVGDSAFVWRVDAGSDAARQGVRPGDQVLSVNGYAPTRRNLWQLLYVFRALRPQPGLRVVLRPPGGEPRQLDLASKVRQRYRIVDLTGAGGGDDIYTLIREAQNEARELRPVLAAVGDSVLVWKLPTFAVDDEAIRDGLRRARGRRTLVLDLRGNGGGPETTLLALLGGLSRDSVRVGTVRERRRERPVVAKGAGEGAFAGTVIVLVDSRSASASEVLARTVQLTGRGVVLGDRTAGAVMRSRYFPLQIGMETAVLYGVSVTEADLVMPDGGRLERVGVAPDTLLLPTSAALAAGEDPVLARALSLAGAPLDPAAAGALLRERR